MATDFVKKTTDALAGAPAMAGAFAAMKQTASSQYVGESANLPPLYTFVGFLDEILVQRPGGQVDWRRLYLDMQLMNWLLVENTGIVREDVVTDDGVPGGQRDIVWVTADTAVGIGRGSQTLEAQFLTGEFTRAADFLASPAGGTVAAATGVFCEAQSVGCCRPSSRPRPR